MAVFVLGENHFRKCFSRNEAVWLVRKILFSGNWNPLTQKNSLWPRKCFYTSIFPSKHFRKMRERERERARAREEKIQARSRAPAPVRDRELQSELQLQSEARSWSREEREIAIAPSIAMSDRDHGAVVVDDFMYFLGCGLCFLICVFLLLFQTPNTRKYFSENFLKCNQTHGNIFLFQKLAFLENMYFPKNVLQQPNTAYMKKSFNFCRKILIGSFSFFIILCSSIFRFETFDM